MRSLRNTIFLFFMALLTLATVINFILVYRSTYQHTRQQAEQQLEVGWQVFSHELASREQSQSTIADLITQDYGLRSELAAFNQQTNVESLRVVLNNFRSRSTADIALATNAEGQVLVATQGNFMLGQKIPLPTVSEPTTTDLFHIEQGRLYQLFVTPVYAPAPNLLGWVVLAFAVNDHAAQELAKLTHAQVSFFQQHNNQYTVLASSLMGEDRQSLQEIDWQKPLHDVGWQHSGDALYYMGVLNAHGQQITVVLQRSLQEALAAYKPLFWQLALIAGLMLLVTLSGAFIIARTVTKPLLALSHYARLLGQGNYDALPPKASGTEVQVLFAEFDAMREAISEREAQIAYAAYHDPLTGLMNRLRFQQVLQDQITAAPQRVCAVVVMGLNHFKDINDTLGHGSGDRLLMLVAERLADTCRAGDYIARFSGDAFAVLMTGIEHHDVLNVMVHYKQILEQPFMIENIAMTVNAGIGISLYPDHAESPTTLLQRAEIAMYVAKEKRLPCALYSQQQNRYSLLRLSLMSELRGAIERGELMLYVQPKRDLNQQQITSVECLVRWQHPIHGFIQPDDFIPLAEQTGNIRYLTIWAIRTAVMQCAHWLQQGLSIEVAVNLSSVDLQDTSLVTLIKEQLELYHVPAYLLCLEVTESAVMLDIEKAISVLADMRQLGVKLAIDDYGTGYSSMAQLKRLPVHEMKIDKSFVLGLPHSADDLIIVRSTIELGHNMGLKLVAEGVESQEAMQLLTHYGCDFAQGYWLSRPMSVNQFEQWYQRQQE